MIVEMHPYGDKELWYASDPNGTWTLPVIVEWRHHREEDKHYALISPALAYYYSQALMMTALFQHHDIMGRKDYWLIPKNRVESLLQKAPGITIAAYYKWPDQNMPAVPLPKTLKATFMSSSGFKPDPSDTDQEAFVKYVAAQSGVQSSMIRVAMDAVADAGPRWMLEKRKAIDFGFCRVFAAPFRANWKEIMGFKFRKWKLLELLRMPIARRDEQLETAGVPQALCSPHNIALANHGFQRIEYTLEATPTKKFDAVVDDVEKQRMSAGPGAYVASFENTVLTLYHEILASLTRYIQKTTLPFAHVCEGGKGGKLRFLPTYGESIKVHGVDLRKLPVHIVSPRSNFSAIAELNREKLVRASPPPLPALPAVPQAADDLREREAPKTVDQPGQPGDNRVPMPNAYQGEAAGQSVLSNGEAGSG